MLTVLGSLNVDYFTRVKAFPDPGETIAAETLDIRFGGKGANQAVASTRMGAQVHMLGCVGRDEMGSAYLQRLSSEGIDVLGIGQDDQLATGSAFIAVDQSGENTIIVAAGANGSVDANAVQAHADRIQKSRAFLAQFETTTAAVVTGLRIASKAGVSTIINPSPLRDDFRWGEIAIDHLITNEGEAEQIFGDTPTIDALQKLRIGHLIVTRGSSPTLLLSASGEHAEFSTLSVQPVDTVGAGDAFAGTYAASLDRGETISDAIRQANVAGALTTVKVGAQEGIPTLEEVRNKI